MLAAVLATATETAEHHTELPMPPVGFGLVALAVFAALFGATWMFRGVANKH